LPAPNLRVNEESYLELKSAFSSAPILDLKSCQVEGPVLSQAFPISTKRAPDSLSKKIERGPSLRLCSMLTRGKRYSRLAKRRLFPSRAAGLYPRREKLVVLALLRLSAE